MSDHNKVDKSKRDFLKKSGYAAGGVVGGTLLGSLLKNPFKMEEKSKEKPEEKEKIDFSETRQFFKQREDFEVLSMATERIFPEDELGSGAIGLGVPYFIDKQLASPWGFNADNYMKKPYQDGEASPLNRRDIFIKGLRKLNEIAKQDYDEPFTDLEGEEQDAILVKFENNEVDIDLLSSAEFFALLREATIDGLYSDPMYGGNKNMEGWKMKEYPGPRVSYLDIIEEDEFVSMDPVSLKTQ